MNFIRIMWLFSVFTMGIRASTHWMVTEEGLIQPRLDSPFEMANPFDLLAFLNQDTRWDNIISLYHDLSKRKDVVRKLWADLERDSNVEKYLSSERSCIRSGPLSMLDWYASTLVDGRSRNIPEKEFKLHKPRFGQDTDLPDCKKISSLTFSMFAFEHLEAMIQRENLTASAELALPDHVSPIMNVDQFGHWVAGALRQNSSSWLHYNIASLFWRVKGNAPKAIECSRRALHYAPREFKDVALLNLGTIFHRCKRPKDAIIVLGAAVDHEPHQSVTHFVLANAYALSEYFNTSIQHYDLCLNYDHGFFLCMQHKYGVLCHINLLKRMKIVQEVLYKLLAEINEYSQREAIWLKYQVSFLKTMKHDKEFDFRNEENNCEKMSELTGLDIKEIKKQGDKNTLIQYFLDGPKYKEKWLSDKGFLAVESAYGLQELVKRINTYADSDQLPEMLRLASMVTTITDEIIKKEIGPLPEFSDHVKDTKDQKSDSQERIIINVKLTSSVENQRSQFEGGIVLFPTNMKINRHVEDFDKDPEWPTTQYCEDNIATFPKNLEVIYPVFLPFENKGIRLKTLLTDMLGVPAHTEHELPWHPPICPQDSSSNNQKKNQKPQIVTEVFSTNYLNHMLLEYVGDGNIEVVKNMQHAEIGHRIYAAMQLELAPKWLLFTLSSLYWRVKGNNQHAVSCLVAAGKTVPLRYRDVVSTSLASVHLEMGYFDEAMAAAEESFKLSLYEPATNFVIAQLNMVKKHRNTQLFHLKQAVRVQPMYMGGVVRYVLNGWACLLHQLRAQEFVDYGEGDICTQLEPGVSMVCEKEGTNCHMTNIHCFHKRYKPEASTLVRMLELKGNNIHEAVPDNIDYAVFFDEFIDNMPDKRSDIAGHQRNFDRLTSTIDTALMGCGEEGCSTLQPEDLALTEDKCNLPFLQKSYWLQFVNFKKLLDDANIRIPVEMILSMTPSEETVPKCNVADEDVTSDFILSRLSRVDTEQWDPVLALMHQFAEPFKLYDYIALGGKIATYVETEPGDWIGALAAGWWCGAGGHGACCVRCLMAAAALAPQRNAREALISAQHLVHMQAKLEDAKDLAYLAFYFSPKSKVEAFLLAVSYSDMAQYDQAIAMYRYSISLDDMFLPPMFCLPATLCLILFGDSENVASKMDEKLE